MVVAPPTEVRYVARVSDAEADRLRKLHQGAPRVHKSLPEGHPRRLQSRELSESLARLHRRGVPIDVLADIVEISHQAVRARIAATELPFATFDDTARGVRKVSHKDVETKAGLADGVLVTDPGMHRRLLVYPNPSVIGHLHMLNGVPFLSKVDQVNAWLESYSNVVIGSAPSSTPLRTPPAVYIPRKLVEELLTELTPSS